MIVQLSEYDLVISYSWGIHPHGISGHTYEVIDYYFLLKDFFKCCILLCENVDKNMLEVAIREKYDFTEDEIADILSHTIYSHLPKLVKGKNILFTDGGIVKLSNVTLLFNSIFMFACGNLDVKNNTKRNVHILQDDRVYDPVNTNGINYKKKILFSRLKKVDLATVQDQTLLYLTNNCRRIDDITFNDIADRYPGRFLCVVNADHNYGSQSDRFTFVVPPVSDIFQQFTRYIYTPIPRKFDCSPRFIAECKFYNKEVVYHNIDYWDEDRGLYWRWWDINNDFSSLHLTKTDDIIRILATHVKY